MCRAAIKSFYEGEASWASVIFGQGVTGRTMAADRPWSSQWEPWENSEERECWDWKILGQLGCGSWVLAGEISPAPEGSLEQGKKTPGVGLVTTFHGETATGVIVLFPEWEFGIVFLHPHGERKRGRETQSVCVHFSGSDIPPKKRSIFGSCGTIMVLGEYLPQNPHKQQGWES